MDATNGIPAEKERNIEAASPNMKRTVGIISLLMGFLLSVLLVDVTLSQGLIAVSRRQATAKVTNLKEATSKGTKTYWVSYAFEAEGRSYGGTSLFGLLSRETRIPTVDRERYQIGAAIEVHYSGLNPSISEIAALPLGKERSIFLILGIPLFFLLGVNEIRASTRKTR